MPGLFLSYRRDDSAGYAGRLRESLERRLGRGHVFRDVDGIGPGQDFVVAIDSRLSECRALIALIGREWLSAADMSQRRRLDQPDDYVRLEIAAALSRPNVLVVPVLVEGMTMPRAEDLPEAIRTLSRRQAISLHDETWDADVDRLLEALPGRARARTAGAWKWAALAVTALVAFIGVRRFNGTDAGPQPDRRGSPAMASGTGAPSARPAAVVTAAPASAIAMPRVAEVVTGSLIYTLLSGSVSPRGATTVLSLRIRLSNDDRFDANFSDATFLLAVGADVLAPTSGLDEVSSAHTLKQGVVRFDVPAGANSAVLKVRLLSGGTAEVPLDLRPTGGEGETDRPDTRDARSQAILAALVREPRVLASGKEIAYTLRSATARRFVNAIRIVFDVHVANRGVSPIAFVGGSFRLVVDGQLMGPVDGPSQVVASNSDGSGDVVFDVPLSTQRMQLRVTDPNTTGEVALDLPSILR